MNILFLIFTAVTFHTIFFLSVFAKKNLQLAHLCLFQSVVNAYAFTDLAGADAVYFIISRIVIQLFTMCRSSVASFI